MSIQSHKKTLLPPQKSLFYFGFIFSFWIFRSLALPKNIEICLNQFIHTAHTIYLKIRNTFFQTRQSIMQILTQLNKITPSVNLNTANISPNFFTTTRVNHKTHSIYRLHAHIFSVNYWFIFRVLSSFSINQKSQISDKHTTIDVT